jgi:hypothetical protein
MSLLFLKQRVNFAIAILAETRAFEMTRSGFPVGGKILIINLIKFWQFIFNQKNLDVNKKYSHDAFFDSAKENYCVSFNFSKGMKRERL